MPLPTPRPRTLAKAVEKARDGKAKVVRVRWDNPLPRWLRGTSIPVERITARVSHRCSEVNCPKRRVIACGSEYLRLDLGRGPRGPMHMTESYHPACLPEPYRRALRFFGYSQDGTKKED